MTTQRVIKITEIKTKKPTKTPKFPEPSLSVLQLRNHLEQWEMKFGKRRLLILGGGVWGLEEWEWWVLKSWWWLWWNIEVVVRRKRNFYQGWDVLDLQKHLGVASWGLRESLSACGVALDLNSIREFMRHNLIKNGRLFIHTRWALCTIFPIFFW